MFLSWNVEMISMRRKNRRAQSAIEFIILVGAVLFFFLVFLFVVQGSISGRVVENHNFALKEIALTVQDEINLAADASDGYYREFEIPIKVVNLDYQISVAEEVVYVKTDDDKYAISLPIHDVDGQVNLGLNFIRKESEVIYLNVDPN